MMEKINAPTAINHTTENTSERKQQQEKIKQQIERLLKRVANNEKIN